MKRVMILAMVCATTLMGLAAPGDDAWWVGMDEATKAAFDEILPGGPTAWAVDVRTRPAVPELRESLGRKAIVGSRLITNILSEGELKPPYEVRAIFRIDSDFGRTTYLRISPSVKEVHSREEDRPYISMSFTKQATRLSFSTYFPEPDTRGRKLKTGYYIFDGNGDRQLSWPDDYRREMEHEAASLTDLQNEWLEVRGVVREESVGWYFNGLMVAEIRDPDLDISGKLMINMMEGFELAELTTTTLDAEDEQFVPVSLQAELNAKTIDGVQVVPESLPARGQRVQVNEVPFVFDEANGQGFDHVDVGVSWFQEGALTGHLSGRGRGVGGRWRGAFYRTPARIQLSVPTHRYKAIHLIAAADSDGQSDPVLTAQFFREQAGFPESFTINVPGLKAKQATATPLPVKLSNGDSANLYHVVIPIDPGELVSFVDGDTMQLELTKAVRLWRAYPDPSYYSIHAAGLPSSVHVYAMTMEVPKVTMTVTPDQYAHVFTAPQTIGYTVELTNQTAATRTVKVSVATTSYDEQETTTQEREVKLAAGAVIPWKLTLPVKLYGLHSATVTLTDGDEVWTERFKLANLHEDTRERGDWDMGKGPFFGYWAWRGGHGTPRADQEALLMGLAGVDGRTGTYEGASEEEKAMARRFKMKTLKHFSGSDHWKTSDLARDLKSMPKEEAIKKFVEAMEKIVTKPSDITDTRYVSFFAEPHLGLHTSGMMPEYWGGDPVELDEATKDRMDAYAEAVRVGVPIIRERWPDAKIMMPHGDPMFATYMLRWAPDIRPLVDGIATDVPCFERLPEMQIHQVAVHRLYQSLTGVRKMLGKEDIPLPMYEGPCVSDRLGAVTPALAADLTVRNCVIMLGYGIDQFTGAYGAVHAGGYWGEQHYGGGLMMRKPIEQPKPMYVAYATMTRQLNRRNYDGWVPTGSTSAYLTRFKHYKDGSLVHVMWQINGKRPVSFAVPAGTKVQVYDQMDNATEVVEKDGQVTVVIGSSPVFIHGLPAEPTVTLGTTDHSDAKPAELSTELGSIGDGNWTMVAKEDLDYEQNTPYHVKRTLGVMSVKTVPAAAEHGGEALAVHLGEQVVDRNTMPYYTQLVAKKPVTIPGQSSHIGLWVRASSDWGRVIYSLRDAKGETWISLGTKEQWNCDDMHSWSYFNFDGWRYVRFEMPSTSAWDSFRNHGTTWWGGHGGDGIVDLPLKLERIIVERRQKAMYVNDPQPTSRDDVLLGGLHVEYEVAEHMTKAWEKRSRIRRPVPEGVPELDNPIAELEANGSYEAIQIEKVTLPDQHADGTRCYVHFPLVDDAEQYSIWAAPYEDGRGAIEVGSRLKASNALVRRLRPETDFWLFVVYHKKDGRTVTTSKPSKAFKIHLEDIFSNK